MQKSKGTALFMAILIVAIVSLIAVTMLNLQRINIKFTQMMLTSEQAYLYSQGIIFWAEDIIKNQLTKPDSENAWPIVLPVTVIANGAGKISGTLQDAEALLNLNSFAETNQPSKPSQQSNTNQRSNSSTEQNNQNDRNATNNNGSSQSKPTSTNNKSTSDKKDIKKIFANLIKILNIPMSEDQQNNLSDAITAWVSSENKAQPNVSKENGKNPSDNASENLSIKKQAAYDALYMQASPPYKSPHKPMVSVSELRTVAGINPAIYNALLPYIVALPTSTELKTKHASPALVQAANISSTNSASNQTNDKTSQKPQPANVQSNPDSSQTQKSNLSKFYLLRGDVFLSDQHLVIYSLLQVQASTSQTPAKVKIMWQSFGTL